MPIALIVAAVQLGTFFVLINMGLSPLHALEIVLGYSVILMLIIFILLVFAMRDDAKLHRLLNEEVNKCIKEIKVCWKNLTNGHE